MFAIDVRFLTGRYAASTHTDAGRAEWPPHPARVYSALTAALYDAPDASDEERLALEWLARAGAPEILCSDATFRQLGDVYVPTNDPKALSDVDRYIEAVTAAERAVHDAADVGKEKTKADRALARARTKLDEQSRKSAEADGKGTPRNAAQVFDGRPRQPRRFPVALPHEELVRLRWSSNPELSVATALDRICARVARLGHPSSLVSLRVSDSDADLDSEQKWTPDDAGVDFFRVPLPDQLALLDEEHRRHQQVEPRVLPADPVRYLNLSDREAPGEALPTSFSHSEDQWVVFRVVPPPEGGRRALLDLSLCQEVARGVRGTLMSQLGRGGPPALTGHAPDGGPTEQPHLAFVPLADIGHSHASGSILGVALLPPRALESKDRDRLIEAVALAERQAAEGEGAVRATERSTRDASRDDPPPLRITLGRHGVMHLMRLRTPSHLRTLRPDRWTEPARRWATATAVALGRNPGNLMSRDPGVLARAIQAAEQTVAAACENIGLRAPLAVWIHRRSLFSGAPAAQRFMPFPSEGTSPRRVCVHAEILFDEPVRGPLVLGAGRFFGLGLCAPMGQSGSARQDKS